MIFPVWYAFARLLQTTDDNFVAQASHSFLFDFYAPQDSVCALFLFSAPCTTALASGLAEMPDSSCVYEHLILSFRCISGRFSCCVWAGPRAGHCVRSLEGGKADALFPSTAPMAMPHRETDCTLILSVVARTEPGSDPAQ